MNSKMSWLYPIENFIHLWETTDVGTVTPWLLGDKDDGAKDPEDTK